MIFNFDEPGWILQSASGDFDDAIIGPSFGYHSAPNALMLGSQVNHFAGPAYGLLEIEPLPLGVHVIRVWLNGDLAQENTPVQLFVIGPGADYFQFVVKKSEIGAGMQLVELGSFVVTEEQVDPTVLLAAMWNENQPNPPDPNPLNFGQWVVDDIEIDPEPEPEPVEEDEELVKLNEIFTALVDACESVKIANGYDVDVHEVVEGPIKIPEGVQYWPSVQIMFPDEQKVPHTLGRVSSDATFTIWAACKRTETTSPGRQCIEVMGAVEQATQKFLDGKFLELGYVTNVFQAGSVSDDFPPEIAKDVRVRAMTVIVTYHHDRRSP